jgi:hypothetical protein
MLRAGTGRRGLVISKKEYEMRKKLLVLAALVAAFGIGATVAFAGGHGGGNSGGVIELSSINSPYYGFVDLHKPGHGDTVSSISTLSTQFAAIAGSECGLGSPRFSIEVQVSDHPTVTKNIFVYLGSAPNFNSCTPGWQDSGNLAADDTSWDTSQLGGNFYDTAGNARAEFGNDKVVGVSLVVDGPNQDFVFSDVTVNDHVLNAHL